MPNSSASDEEIAKLLETLEGEGNGEPAIEALLARYPGDPRLHFMRGSLLAETGRAIEAHRAMSRAVELDPGYALARYQLGLFELSSGEPVRAMSTWGPLLTLGSDSPLRKFVEGMAHLVRDEFDDAISQFEQGVALNHENEPMNRDIRLLIERCRELQGATPQGIESDYSATSLMLNRSGGSRTIQ